MENIKFQSIILHLEYIRKALAQNSTFWLENEILNSFINNNKSKLSQEKMLRVIQISIKQ